MLRPGRFSAIVVLSCALVTLSRASTVRLAGGVSIYEGRVEVLYNGIWGTICDDGWDISDAHVVCGMLGYGDATSAFLQAWFGEGTGTVWLDDVECQGSESDIELCRHSGWGVEDCEHSEDASVICSIPGSTVRLANGNRFNEGRVELLYNGEWGTICDDSWDVNDAYVVCNMLGFKISPTLHFFGSGTGQIWLDDLNCIGYEASVANCAHGGWGSHNCDHSEDAGVVCKTYGDVRLVNGTSINQGRVEILFNGQWGTICDDSWNIEEAEVVCNMLGFNGAVSALRASYYGQGTGVIWLDNVNCAGSEFHVERCSHGEWGSHDCDHSEDASVICGNVVRLVGGSSLYEGRVEVLHNGVWGTICDDSWDLSDAQVICSMLGYGSAITAPASASFGPGTGQIWLDDVRCVGHEHRIEFCDHRGWGNNNCAHSEDAAVTCTGPVQGNAVRLVGGSSLYEGRVEILHNGVWGTICDDSWDLSNAQVICSMLGYGSAITAPLSATFGPGTGQIWLDEVDCVGDEHRIDFCAHGGWGNNDCTHSEDAAVTCTGHAQGNVVRLVGGSSLYEGRVEIFHNGVWGTICDDSWDLSDAQVICSMLGYGSAITAPLSASFGPGTGQIWLDDVICVGDEHRIEFCAHGGWGNNDCTHSEDAAVTCTSPVQGNTIRLADGGGAYQGRVEVLHNGEWGTICDDHWSLAEASVVCRMLGYDSAISGPTGAFFGEGAGPIWMDQVTCSSGESFIGECSHSGWGNHDCDHSEDASVVCQTSGTVTARISGNSHNAGRVEIQHNGVWGTVCNQSWSINEANVVCRMLGYEMAAAAFSSASNQQQPFRQPASHGPGSGVIWLDGVDCDGTERTIDDCSHGGWGIHSCTHMQDATVTCKTSECSDDGDCSAGSSSRLSAGAVIGIVIGAALCLP